MFNDDSWGDEDDFDSLDELISAYKELKSGNSVRFLEEEDYELIIDYFNMNSQEKEALIASELALSYYPNSTSILLLKAEILFHAQKQGQALHTLDELDKLQIPLLDAVLLRSDIYLAQFKYDYAAQFLSEQMALFEGKEKIEIMLELSDVYDECEQYDAVFEILKKIVEIDPRCEEALHKISFWADFAGMHDESIVLHNKIIEEDPFNALAWFNLGAAYQGKKSYLEAIDAYEYCVAIDEKFEFAYRNMADAYMRLNRYDKAIESLQMNLELGKPEDVIYEAMGHCFEKQKNFKKARYYYRLALELSPEEDNIFFRIGETYSREQKWIEAEKSYSSALAINRENANYFLSLGKCMMEMGSYNEAMICYLSALQLKPQNKTNWMALLKSLMLTERYEEALLQLQDANDIIGQKPDFDYYHAGILFALGKTKEAMLFLEKALNAAPQKLKILIEIQPELLQRQSVASLVTKYKRKK